MLITYLGAYGLIFVFLSIGVWFVRNIKTENNKKDYGNVSIMIPAYNEGEGIVDTVSTIVKQDYPGFVKIFVLACNAEDNFVRPLKKAYRYGNNDSKDNVLKLFTGSKREIYLIFTGLMHKKDKINFWTPNVSANYIGLLDADHRAENNWISSSLSKMDEEKTNIIQSRRQPLSISTIFQIWDSAQNHIGNEMTNLVLNNTSHSVFFTGTTCIFKTDIFKKYKFGENLTEDTNLSYDLICEGEKISYNYNSSSYEEVAYDARSYVFRRRRWSAGHTKTFIDHLKKIIKEPLDFLTRIKLFVHGQFYLLPIAIALLLNIYGVYFFFQFTINIRLATLLVSVLISLALSVYFKKKGNNFIVDSFVSFLWIFPQVSVLAIWIYKILGSEIYYYIISFPFTRIVSPFQITLLLIPLITIFSGIVFFKKLGNIKNLLLIPTYPIFLFLDIYACILGFVDFIFGKYNWVEIGRKNFISEETVPTNMRSEMSTGKTIKTGYKKLIWITTAAIVILLINDLLAFDNCGDTKAFLWQPIFIHSTSSAIIKLDIEKRIIGTSTLEISIKNKFSSTGKIKIDNYLDNKLISNKTVIGIGEDIEILDFPLGWESHKINVIVNGTSLSCSRTEYFSTTFKEIIKNSLFINGEKFLIKGIIPSFSNSLTNLSLDVGLKQIKNAGANTVRFYHNIGKEIRDYSAKYNLMIIDQPDQSTWNELNLYNPFSEKLYQTRYKKMVSGNKGFPFLLFNGLGNEWELGGGDPNILIPKIKNLITDTTPYSSSELSTYSTYLTFINYPVDVLGVNMLDTSPTYWNKAIGVLKEMKKPFYASEFGGFVAFWETVPSNLRIARFTNYWNELLNAGGLGANFFESHDNWAQPVVNGYNDPFKPDQPDDTRGLWDKNNNEKLEMKFLREMFSDFQINIVDKVITPGTKETEVEFINKREYALKDVTLNYSDKKIFLGDFKPEEFKIVKLPIDSLELSNPAIQFIFNYTTHSGFKEISTNDLILPIESDVPIILNNDFIVESSSADSIKGKMIHSNKIEALIPENWQLFEFNGKQIDKNAGRIQLSIENPYHDVSNLQFSSDGLSWSPFDSEKIGGGIYYLRFRLPKVTNSEKYLILAGLGASTISIDYGNGNPTTINTFNYRENIIDLSPLGREIFNNYITLRVDRQQTIYITKQDSPSEQEISINIEKPVIFSPADIEIKKI